MHGCISETVLSLFWGVTCWAFHDDSVVKNLLANARDAGDVGLTHGVRKILWRRKWQSVPVFLPRKIPWTEELADYSP